MLIVLHCVLWQFVDRCVGLLTSFDLGIPGSGAAHDMHELTAARLSAPIRLTRVMRVCTQMYLFACMVLSDVDMMLQVY